MRTLTKAVQETLTPEMAIDLLKKGNQRFVSNLKINRNLLQQVNETSEGQHPFAVVISCMDSRTSAELVFDQGLGDIFSIRIAGNVINEEIVGSAEFGCKVAGAKVVLVLGHTNCGAVKGAVQDVELGHLHFITTKIKRSIQTLNLHKSTHSIAEKCAKVEVQNVIQGIRDLQQSSTILSDLVYRGEIRIVGGMYDLSTGVVEIFDDKL